MSMDLTGIRNRNEYYTNHYFASIFEENASDTIKRWREAAQGTEQRTPWALLRDAGKRYFLIRGRQERRRGVLGRSAPGLLVRGRRARGDGGRRAAAHGWRG